MFQKLITKIAMLVMLLKGKRSLRSMERSSRAPMEENGRLLKKIIRKNRNTEYGKAHDFAGIRSLEDFRNRVPLSEYEDFSPYIERMKNGEGNLLTREPVLGYSRTSGSSGIPKYIPSTRSSLDAYVKYTWTRALALGAEALKRQGKRFRPGRGIFLSPATNDRLPSGLLCSNIAEVGAERYGFVYPYILTVPQKKLFDMHDGDYLYSVFRFGLADEDATFIFSVFYSVTAADIGYLERNWNVLVDDIEKGVISDSVDLRPEVKEELRRFIRPMPERAAYLRRQFEQGVDGTLLKRLWPNMTFLSGIGNASFESAANTVRRTAEGIPLDYSIYGASEGLVAACYKLECADMQLLTDSCFYEFRPADSNTTDLLTLEQLKQGERYEIFITTQAWLYSYHLKDVIEVRGFRNQCPLISFVYRKGQLFNVAGEKFSEEDARTSIAMLEKAHGVSIEHWLFYQDTSVNPNRYSLVAENTPGIDLEECIDELEEYMGQCNKRYTSQRAKFFISRLRVQEQRPGTHDAWAERCIAQGASVGQIKPVHSLDNPAKREFFLSRIK